MKYKREEMVTIPIQHYMDLTKEHLYHMAALNGLKNNKELYEQGKQELIDIWKEYYPDIKTFDDLIEKYTKTSLAITISEMEEEIDEYELYCK